MYPECRIITPLRGEFTHQNVALGLLGQDPNVPERNVARKVMKGKGKWENRRRKRQWSSKRNETKVPGKGQEERTQIYICKREREYNCQERNKKKHKKEAKRTWGPFREIGGETSREFHPNSRIQEKVGSGSPGKKSEETPAKPLWLPPRHCTHKHVSRKLEHQNMKNFPIPRLLSPNFFSM
jgi:hypothetical protein